MQLETLAILNAERAARRAAILVTDLDGGVQRVVREAEIAGDPLADLLARHLAAGKSGLAEADGRSVFLTVQAPPVRLVVIGAVHISQALCPMARALDLAVTVIDPRTAFATPETAKGTFGANLFSARIEVGQKFLTGGPVNVTPFFAFEPSWLVQDAYSETGAATIGLGYGKTTTTALPDDEPPAE